jgi:hypothetical protein
MKLVIPGGSGQVGTLLARAFHAEGHEIVVLSRRPASAPWRTVAWDGENLGDWVAELDGAEVVINLAGRNVNCRYTAANRRLILDSRVNSTRVLGAAIAQAHPAPRLWLQASTATIYAHRYDAPNDEATGRIGGFEPGAPRPWTFSIEVARAWEQAVDEAQLPRTRTVKMRSAITLSPDPGGIFDTILRLVRLGLGGRHGDGQQFVSWVHYEDFIRAVKWLIDHPQIQGPVNIAAPFPLPNDSFMQILRQAWGSPVGLPATRWMLEIGALILQTETELLLKSRRVVPGKLTKAGFRYRFPDWDPAARDLCRQWRRRRQQELAQAGSRSERNWVS